MSPFLRTVTSSTRVLKLVLPTLILIIGVVGSVRGATSTVSPSTFTGTTFTNDHLRMEIGALSSVMYGINQGDLLVQNMNWGVEMRSNGSWVPMSWTLKPTVSTENIGTNHRVSIRGIMNDVLAVGIYYDGKATNAPTAALKATVEIQSIKGYGTYRIVWQFDGVTPQLFRLDNRIGTVSTPVYGPVGPVKNQLSFSGRENSLVALSSDLLTVRFGLNWQDARAYYRGGVLSDSRMGSNVRVFFGDFSLANGQQAIVDPYADGGGGGGSSSPQVIYNVVSSGNSLSGTTDTISWLLSPAVVSCGVFEYTTSPTSWSNAIVFNPPCGTQSVSLTGLTPHVRYYFQIGSYAQDGSTSVGWYTGSFYTTDVTTSRAYEGYYQNPQFSTFCGSISDQTNYSTESPGDIEYDPSQVSNSNHYEVFDLHFHFDSLGQSYCWPWTLGAKYTQVDLWVYDPSGVINWINSKGNIIYSGYAGGSATVSWTIFFQGGSQYGQAGFSATTTPSQAPTVSNNMNQNLDQTGGWKYVGYFKFNWPMQIQVGFDVIVPMIVTDQLAQYRLYDIVNFKVQDTVTYDGFNGSWWAGNDITFTYPTYLLGDGDYNGSNQLDQYTDVQQGTSNGPVT